MASGRKVVVTAEEFSHEIKLVMHGSTLRLLYRGNSVELFLDEDNSGRRLGDISLPMLDRLSSAIVELRYRTEKDK